MSQPSSSRPLPRSLLLSLVLFALAAAVLEFRRREMQHNQARFRARYDPTGTP